MNEIIVFLEFVLQTIQTHGVLAGIFVFLICSCYIGFLKWHKWNKEKKHIKSLTHRKEADILLKSSLNMLLNKLGAARAMVCEYHNGGCNFSGLAFYRMSATVEVTTYCTPDVSKQYEAIMSSQIREIITDAEEKGIIYIKNLKESKYSYQFLRDTLIPVGTKQVILLPISGTKTSLGLLIIGFNHAKPINEEKIKSVVIPEIQKISSILDYKN